MRIYERAMNNVWLFWFALTLPLIWLVLDKLITGVRLGKMFYWTGVISLILIFICLAITPLRRVFRGASWIRWLASRRRYIGVAGFAYTLIHTLVWIRQIKIERFLESFTEIGLITAWLGFIILIAMAVTSNDLSVRKLGPKWKSLQRWVLVATPLALFHWFIVSNFRLDNIVIYGGAFVLIMLSRVVVNNSTSQNQKG